MSSLLEGKVENAFCAPGFSDTRILTELKKRKITWSTKPVKELDETTEGANHQGIIAYAVDFSYKSLEEITHKAHKSKYPLLIMLDEINDPHNLGAILRSADAFGANGVIVKKHNQVGLTAVVAKVSTGAINYVDVCQVTNLTNTLVKLKAEGYWIVASDGGSKQDYRSVDYKMPVALVVGGEGKGVSRLVLENSDFMIKIPMTGHVNSLNASVATAVLLAQIDRKSVV